jgi:hypothetical protein
MVRFDAYTATTREASRDDLLNLVCMSGDEVRSGRGFHTFGERYSVIDPTGDQVGSVLAGGRQGDRVMVEVKGDRTPAVVEALRGRFAHRCTRVDTCADFDRPGAFEELLAPVLRVKEEFDLYGERRGDWDKPELGRTIYLGAPTSAIRFRLYEKGKQPELRHLNQPDRVRAELQIRPAKEARDVYAGVSASDAWGASRWTRALAGELLGQMLDPVPPGTIWKRTKREQALRWMVRQYGPHLVSLAEDLGGWDCVGLTLREMLEEERK